MTKEEILKIIENGEVDITELDKSSSYIVSVEAGDTPREQVEILLNYLSDKLRSFQIKHFVIVPTYNGIPSLKFYEFKDNKVSVAE